MRVLAWICLVTSFALTLYALARPWVGVAPLVLGFVGVFLAALWLLLDDARGDEDSGSRRSG